MFKEQQKIFGQVHVSYDVASKDKLSKVRCTDYHKLDKFLNISILF